MARLAWKRLQIYTDLLLIITSTADELSGGTNIDDLEWPWTRKIGGFSKFFAISGCDTRLRVNCAETIQDRPGQPAHEMFGIKRRYQRCKVRPLGWRGPPYKCIKFRYPLQNERFLLLSTNLAQKRLQIATDLLHIITSTAGELSVSTNIDDLERPWTPKIGGFCEFFAILGCGAHLESEFSLKLQEMDQDNLRAKLNWCCRASHEH